MMTDTLALAASAALTFVMIMVASTIRGKSWTPEGARYGFGNREEPLPGGVPAVGGRADRAAKNMLENMVMFTAIVAAVHLSGHSGARSTLGATVFFWARVAYFLTYLAGIPYLRTIWWLSGVCACAWIASSML